MKVLTSCFIFVLLSLSLSAELIDEQIANEAESKYDRFAKNRFLSINETLIKELRDDSDIKKINVVNTWMNQIRYKSDKQVYGVSDYWATLYEFVGKNKGDCEDYTIAKYYVLKELGIDPNRMKFTYVVYQDARGRKISHMVLAYFTVPNPTSKDEILLLDNNNMLVLPASKRPDIVQVVKMINGDTGAKSKKWKILEEDMKRKKL